MRVPGIAWVVLLLAVIGFVQDWLKQWVQEPWIPLVIMALSLVAKAIDIYLTGEDVQAMRGRAFDAVQYTPRPVWQRLLLG